MCLYACAIRALRYGYDFEPQVKNKHTLMSFSVWGYLLVKGAKCFLLLCISVSRKKKSTWLKLESQNGQYLCL